MGLGSLQMSVEIAPSIPHNVKSHGISVFVTLLLSYNILTNIYREEIFFLGAVNGLSKLFSARRNPSEILNIKETNNTPNAAAVLVITTNEARRH